MRLLVALSAALLALSLACSGPSPSDPVPAPAPEEPKDRRGTGATRSSTPAPQPQPAIEGGCALEQPTPTLSKGIFSVSICPNVAARGPVYVGVTVQTEDGHRRDLPYVTVPLEDRGKPLTIREAIGPEYERWVTVIWGEEVTCEGTDPDDGCTRFGHALADPLWEWPRWRSDALDFEEIAPIRVQLLDSGGGSRAISEAKSAVASLTTDRRQAPPTVDGGVAQKKRDHIEILYKRNRFRPLADEIRAALPKDRHYVMTLWREAPEAVVIAMGL